MSVEHFQALHLMANMFCLGDACEHFFRKTGMDWGLNGWELFPSTQLNQIQIQIKRVAREFHKQKPGLLKRLRKENQRTSSVLDLNRGKQKIGNWKSGLYIYIRLCKTFLEFLARDESIGHFLEKRPGGPCR